ncbi:hypothetical protein ACFWXK_20425 [Streptomyces sp. NPDC059070]|uniref:hypothetical protein n=1 Tax=Streptomyces sp. NPDC059070 TaxID=3346713 RepID=UPI0036C085CA
MITDHSRGFPLKVRRSRGRAVLAAFAVAASSLAFATAGPANIASAQARPCPQDDGQRVMLGTPVNIWDRQENAWPQHHDTSLGILYLGYIPKCRQVYAEANLNASGNAVIQNATVYVADERHNSEGRIPFTNPGGAGTKMGNNGFLTSGYVSIDVPEYDAGSVYAAPKAFKAELEYHEYMGCSADRTSGTHQFSDGANFNSGNGVTCSHA